MIQIEETLISLDVIEKKFFCNLSACKGACCILGDAGAPLTHEEVKILEEIFPEVEKYMQKIAVRTAKQYGLYYIDAEGDYVTQLIDNKECIFVIYENGIAKCAIEKAFFDNKIKFRKPLSCHLYPIRIKKYTDYDAINYNKWEICAPALKTGEEKNIHVYEFVKDALIRKYGEEWYNKLKKQAEIYFAAKKSS